jgi:hypothetical protein
MGSITRIKHGISNMNWANDNMSFADACRISNNFYKKVIDKKIQMGISMYAFSDHAFYGLGMEEIMKIDFTEQPMSTSEPEQAYRKRKLQ